MKAITMYRPRVLENALTGFDRYLDSFFNDSFLTPADRIFNRLPAVDIRETEKSWILEADLPGYDEKNIDIHLESNTLTIESKESTETSTKNDKTGYVVQERRQASFSRSFTLPDNADKEAVSASYKNGVLCVEIGKLAETQKRVIEISKS